MKKLLYISVILAVAAAGAVQAGTLSAALKQQVKSIEVPVPSVATGADVKASAGTNAGAGVKVETGAATKGTVKVGGSATTEVKTATKVEATEKEDIDTGADANVDVTAEGEMGDKENKDTDTTDAEVTAVSVSAVEVRGWNPEKKAEILGAALTRTQVRSGKDLSNFAATMVINDENIDSVDVDSEQIEVAYKFPAKFLGIFETNIRAHVTVASSATSGKSRVKVKFPWLAFLYKIEASVKADALTEALDTQIAGETHAETATEAAVHADTLDLVGAVLRVKHDTAMSSIRNMK